MYPPLRPILLLHYLTTLQYYLQVENHIYILSLQDENHISILSLQVENHESEYPSTPDGESYIHPISERE